MDRKLIEILKFIEEEIGLEVSEVSDGNYIVDSADFVIDIKEFAKEQQGGKNGR